ncbi:hypothetical protein QBC38DRAFT_466155 [Podospora fimiseda]|uniref:Uncharacterized protein n=1 Tax=Podospora fimiseda TaxID=252190 RepID=A0AAN7H1N1_9PEZI|nr:hypothetical protein QBC38DRAFT_466155 [Podospora fimiseda]
MDLCLTILSLTPGFSVKQLWPAGASHQVVKRETEIGPENMEFTIKLPEEVRVQRGDGQSTSHRDIIWIIVTDEKREGLSWRFLELPEIWQIDAKVYKQRADRNAEWVRSPSHCITWWVQDKPIYTPDLGI